MIDHPAFAPDPWAVRETELHLDVLAQTESVFALGNGHLGLRGNLDEGDPAGLPGTYLNGVHEVRPLPYAETAYGNPEAGETVLNVTDGKPVRLLVGDELFDVRYGSLLEHERVLDLRDGVLRRSVHWRSPAGHDVRVRSQRIVSLTQRGAAAIMYGVEPVGARQRIVIQSELVANGDGRPPGAPDDDPRGAVMFDHPLVAEQQYQHGHMVFLAHRTRHSGLLVAAGMDHLIEGPDGTEVDVELSSDVGRVTVAADVPEGGTLRVLKFLSYGWSGYRSLSSVRAQVHGGLAEARHTGWDGLCAAQRELLDRFWAQADVEIDGDAELQQALRFALFHTLQAGVRAERRPIAAKGLTGSGYDGHAFWDTESYVLPVLTYTWPSAVGDALRWRHATIDLARQRAGTLGLKGAAFPWRTITGRECSGYWPAGTAAFHIGADIAAAVDRYQHAVDDRDFEHDAGVELLVETARLWRSLGHHDKRGEFRIPGVTGPDEYSAAADDNVYTNLMAARNLRAAAEAVGRHPQTAQRLRVDGDEIQAWRTAADAVRVPYDAILEVHQQADRFTEHAWWDFEHTGPEDYPLLLHFPYFDLYRKQVVKQADLVLALYTCGSRFSDEEKARDFEYYESLTVRDSSLSASIQAVMAAETGHLALAYDYLGEAALMDLHDLEHNTRDGLHIASLAGSWIAVVGGFGGFRDHEGRLTFAPRLPEDITRLKFRLAVRGARLAVEVTRAQATYELEVGDTLQIAHEGEELIVRTGAPETRALTRPPRRARPSQPPGREPRRRGAGSG